MISEANTVHFSNFPYLISLLLFKVMGEKKYFKRGDLSAKMSEEYLQRHSGRVGPDALEGPVGSAIAPEKEKEELIKIKEEMKGKSELATKFF